MSGCNENAEETSSFRIPGDGTTPPGSKTTGYGVSPIAAAWRSLNLPRPAPPTWFEAHAADLRTQAARIAAATTDDGEDLAGYGAD